MLGRRENTHSPLVSQSPLGWSAVWERWVSLVAPLVKNPPPVWETLVPFLGREDPLEKIGYPLHCSWASLVAQLVKNLPAMQET